MADADSPLHFTVSDLPLFPDDSRRREIINGELCVSWAPHYKHQSAGNLCAYALTGWNDRTQVGEVLPAPTLILGELDVVIPDLVWISRERLAQLVDEAGHLCGASELVVEVLTPGEMNERRDREVKRKLYSMYSVSEYWIVDWRSLMVAVYRYEESWLYLEATLWREDTLTSPLLPGFEFPVARLFR